MRGWFIGATSLLFSRGIKVFLRNLFFFVLCCAGLLNKHSEGVKRLKSAITTGEEDPYFKGVEWPTEALDMFVECFIKSEQKQAAKKHIKNDGGLMLISPSHLVDSLQKSSKKAILCALWLGQKKQVQKALSPRLASLIGECLGKPGTSDLFC